MYSAILNTKKEDLRKVRELKYIQDEYVSQLEQCVINKYYEVYEEKQEAHLKQTDDENASNDYSKIQSAQVVPCNVIFWFIASVELLVRVNLLEGFQCVVLRVAEGKQDVVNVALQRYRGREERRLYLEPRQA